MPATLTRQSNNGTRTQAPPASATQRAATRSRSRVVLGAAVLVVAALAGAMLYADVGHRHPVLEVAHPVTAGQVLQARDFTTARVAADPGVATVPASRESSVVGHPAAVALVAGALLAPADVASAPVFPSGSAVIGATLKPGQAPVGLRPGDVVLVVMMPSQSGSRSGTSQDLGTPTTATVVAVNPLADTNGAVAVSLAVPADMAPPLAVAGAGGTLALILAPQ